jgi:hypothetical protein
MKIVTTLASLFFLAASMPAVSAEKWVTIFTGKAGYDFKGQRKTDKWAFHVPGHTIRTKDDPNRMITDIDGVIVQVLTVPLSDFPGRDPLAQYRKYESDYLAGFGIHISPSKTCASMKLPHQEWRATTPGNATSTYITVATATHILVVVVAYDKTASVMSANAKLTGICSSLVV